MEKNNNDRQKLVITLGLKFEEMAAHCDVIAQRLADIKRALQQLADSANRQELKDKIECGELSLGIEPIKAIDLNDGVDIQTIADVEAYLIKKFTWREGANYITVDGPGTDGISEVWQWGLKPTKLIYEEGWSNFGVDIPAAAPIGYVALPENIDWKDCLFTRTTNETNE